jgi:hypothetical protein
MVPIENPEYYNSSSLTFPVKRHEKRKISQTQGLDYTI